MSGKVCINCGASEKQSECTREMGNDIIIFDACDFGSQIIINFKDRVVKE